MVNWNDPTTILKQSGTPEALLKLVHVMDGIYMRVDPFSWEFISTCGYEWRIARGQQHWEWTLWLYLGCRFFTLAEVIADLTGFNVTRPINCQLWAVLQVTFAYTASSLALALYGLRTIAIWKMNKLICLFIATISTGNVALWVYTITQASKPLATSRSYWSSTLASCVVTDTTRALPSTSSTLIVNCLILVTMVIGILRTAPKRSAVLRLFFREGVFWLSVATLVQILPSTFVALNLNDTMNLMFQTPTLICSTIGATRIYRALSERNFSGMYVSPSFASATSVDRNLSNRLEYWDSSIDATTGELRFRRRGVNAVGSTQSGVGVPMAPIKREHGERYVERFEAREIKLDDVEMERDGDVKGTNRDYSPAFSPSPSYPVYTPQ
ncbi:hypothetical protein K488DRAFT_82959 [Vararia minispora EC-137]|uniref:Uncharacterized protein n=1 Tax=Vararia minispora EC-137 TaxID=1314806 RepID=A0ACB8QUM0_9AGAM|nr:hypothetical protein K488DRAFT_82959 [Vararia minispora EC-137]